MLLPIDNIFLNKFIKAQDTNKHTTLLQAISSLLAILQMNIIKVDIKK
jgi:hypothetical protein